MKIYFISLGCDKNLVDSEYMLGLIRDKGLEVTDDEDEADVIVINTCSFILDAREESINTILTAVSKKHNGKCSKVIVTGCLAQRYQNEIFESIPEIDAIVGTTSFDRIVDAIIGENADDGKSYIESPDRLCAPHVRREVTIQGGYAYLKIADGCNKHCTYCSIPSIRGRYRSVPMEQLLNEARYIAENGVTEIILVAQETTVYGIDIYGEKKLPELIRNISTIDGISNIRLLYCYPEEITDELIAVIRDDPKVCHYIDMPIQHSSDRILRKMGRRTTSADIKKRISELRREIPDIVIRTSLITGFPGETLRDHLNMLKFLKEMHIERVGVFEYSREEGTKAYDMIWQVPKIIKKLRKNRIMRTQMKISYEFCRSMIGKTLEVTVEGRMPDVRMNVGRTYMDAPNVDGYVFFRGDKEYLSGTKVKVLIEAAQQYDLYGEVTDEFTE